MKISVSSLDITQIEVDVLVLPTTENNCIENLEIWQKTFGFDEDLVSQDFAGKVGENLLLYSTETAVKRLLLLGLGAEEKLDMEQIRRQFATLAPIFDKLKKSTLGVVPDSIPFQNGDSAQAIVESIMLATYKFEQYFTQDKETTPIERIVFCTNSNVPSVRAKAMRGKVLAEAVNHARDLVNLSPNDKTPTQLAKYASQSAKKYGYEATVWDKPAIEAEKMGGLLAVNLGSQEPPTFTILEWKPEHAVNNAPVVLVGKGVVFDTGGLSLKPTENSMDLMKCDMAGAAAVMGAMQAIARLEIPLHIVALIPATDNRPGENAYVPGDVIKMHSGTTVEVLNTDAEGRMILADALSYAKHYNPELVVDLATLTGAQVVALGYTTAAVMTNEDEKAHDRIEAFQQAGKKSGDWVAPLPMFEEYGEQLKSLIADLKNVGGRPAGSITAGKFLEHFTDYPWVHLDIAGTVYGLTPKYYHPAGARGFGVRLLVEFLSTHAKNYSE